MFNYFNFSLESGQILKITKLIKRNLPISYFHFLNYSLGNYKIIEIIRIMKEIVLLIVLFTYLLSIHICELSRKKATQACGSHRPQSSPLRVPPVIETVHICGLFPECLWKTHQFGGAEFLKKTKSTLRIYFLLVK